MPIDANYRRKKVLDFLASIHTYIGRVPDSPCELELRTALESEEGFSLEEPTSNILNLIADMHNSFSIAIGKNNPMSAQENRLLTCLEKLSKQLDDQAIGNDSQWESRMQSLQTATEKFTRQVPDLNLTLRDRRKMILQMCESATRNLRYRSGPLAVYEQVIYEEVCLWLTFKLSVENLDIRDRILDVLLKTKEWISNQIARDNCQNPDEYAIYISSMVIFKTLQNSTSGG
jgi:hypothetical protein